ncbi:MAG: hypothetical protein EBS53_10470 [Bacteroidetes bacterium]|nr:hypothetical protein [Bacteroidota bacterium]
MNSDMEKALKLCRGSYQRDIILGHANVSGSDLAGKAREYGARYKNSRNALFTRMENAKINFCVDTSNKKHTLVFGEREVFLAKHGRTLREKHPEIYTGLVNATKTGKKYKAVRALAELALET